MTRPRRGPRPLALHLSLLAARRATALGMLPLATASPGWNAGWPRSKPGQAALQRIAARLAAAGTPPEAFAAAVLRALNREDAALLAGIRAYRAHPSEAPRPAAPLRWAEGSARLLDYGGAGPTLLVIPSLVNRAQVLDLLPEASMLRHLAGAGLRPLLLDWGAPGEAERGFTLTDLVAGRLERALAAIGHPVILAGYCMGGLLALAAAQRNPGRVRALALLATPWDFWAEGAARPRALAALLPALEPLMARSGTLPVDVLQALFVALDPFGSAARFRGFTAADPASPATRRLVALEDWLNDGIALPAAIAREAIGGWYGANSPASGAWRIAGAAVDPGALRLPSFIAIPARDRIVPPAAAAPLVSLIPGALSHRAPAGHIGMVAGSGAEASLWRPLLAWARGLRAQ